MIRDAWQAWPVFVIRWWVRETWRALPGPWWVRAVILAAVLAIPGPQDELVLFAVLALARRWRNRRRLHSATV